MYIYDSARGDMDLRSINHGNSRNHLLVPTHIVNVLFENEMIIKKVESIVVLRWILVLIHWCEADLQDFHTNAEVSAGKK